ncbi:MAG TPA: YbhB/YbcL family Raf kinase inhibitor-like protein [Gemmatimonadales bacterium]|nr:YbhB/YbcL family Raf kinase inhibitor-like protein [Gemmatimonadales bacterium]
MALKLSSPAFEAGGAIPAEYTCDGRDAAPALEWSGAPAGTKSFALIVDDPDAPDPRAPRMTWVHWVLYDIPAAATGLPKGATTRTLPAGTREGLNDWKRTRYGGPCPPIGRHRYFHKLYALDTVLGDLKRPTKAKLEAAMKGHVLARAELMGTYERRQ